MYILTLLLLIAQASDPSKDSVEKIVIYKKETSVDLEGLSVQGELKLPPAFFISERESADPGSLLKERLEEPLRNQSQMIFY